MKKIILLSFVLLICTFAVFSQNGIRDIDFKNFTYQPVCETQEITVKDGMFYEEKVVDGSTRRFYFNAFNVIYGDVDGDNADEAIVLTLCNMGGTGNFTEGLIYGMKDGQTVLMARIEGGDRAIGGLREVSIENGKIIKVERSVPGETGAACCPEKIETAIYRFENDALAQIGEKTQKEIYPLERVEFEEGKSSKLLKLLLKSDDQIKRFVISAKKGKILEVITSSPDVKVRLHKGNAKVLNENEKLFKGLPATNEFAAKLRETGDFVFEVSNFSNIDLNFFVTVKIR